MSLFKLRRSGKGDDSPGGYAATVRQLAASVEEGTGQLGTIAALGHLYRVLEGKEEATASDRTLAAGIKQLAAKGDDVAGPMVDIIIGVVGPDKVIAQHVLEVIGPPALPAIEAGLARAGENSHLETSRSRIQGEDPGAQIAPGLRDWK